MEYFAAKLPEYNILADKPYRNPLISDILRDKISK